MESKSKLHLLYLGIAGLLLAAVLIGYNVFSAPRVEPVIITSNYEATTGDGKEDVPSSTTKASSGSKTTNSSGSSKTTKAAVNYPININTADAALLAELPGIGPAKAAAIIEYRTANGPFARAEDLLYVSGIGEKTLENMYGYITVG